MAYTFDELAAWWRDNGNLPSGSNRYASGTIVRIQDDGRTGFLPFTVGYVQEPGFYNLTAFGNEQFSDRMVVAPYNYQNPSTYYYEQNFDSRNAMGVQSVDPATLKIQSLVGTKYEVQMVFTRWGAISNYEINLVPGTKMYVGYGSAIGNGPSTLALYTVSIQSVGITVIG